MSETEKRVLRLFGEIAAVVEKGNYTYAEAVLALSKLSEHYRMEGQFLLDSTSIIDVAQYRQHQYAKRAAAPRNGTAADG